MPRPRRARQGAEAPEKWSDYVEFDPTPQSGARPLPRHPRAPSPPPRYDVGETGGRHAPHEGPRRLRRARRATRSPFPGRAPPRLTSARRGERAHRTGGCARAPDTRPDPAAAARGAAGRVAAAAPRGARAPAARTGARSGAAAAAGGEAALARAGRSAAGGDRRRAGAARPVGLHLAVRLDLDAVRRGVHLRATRLLRRAVHVRVLRGARVELARRAVDLGLGRVAMVRRRRAVRLCLVRLGLGRLPYGYAPYGGYRYSPYRSVPFRPAAPTAPTAATAVTAPGRRPPRRALRRPGGLRPSAVAPAPAPGPGPRRGFRPSR